MKIAAASLCRIIAIAVALIAAPPGGAAQRVPCNQRDNVLGHLAEKYKEVPIAIGVTNRGGLVEVLSTGDGNTWTIIISSPDGEACMVAAGEGWRVLPKADTPDGPIA